MEEQEKEQVYINLEVVNSSLKMHKKELDKGWSQSEWWKEIWMNSTITQKEMREGFEARIQGLEA